MKGRGIVIRQPTVVATDKYSGQIIAIGNSAKEMHGRTPENIETTWPLKDGVIADFTATKKMLRYFVEKACQNYLFNKPRIVIGVPLGVTEVEESAVEEAALEAGAREVFLIEEPMAAAIGAGLKISEASGSMIVDIGGGTTEIAVISMGGIIASRSIRVAGDEITESIIEYIKREYNVLIGKITAENIKHKIGTAYPSMTIEEMDIKGRSLQNGLPEIITISSAQIEGAMKDVLLQIIGAIKQTLEITPTELASDLMLNGITICGGTALIKNIDRLIAMETGLPVNIAKNPTECVVTGASKVLEDIHGLKKLLKSSKQGR